MSELSPSGIPEQKEVVERITIPPEIGHVMSQWAIEQFTPKLQEAQSIIASFQVAQEQGKMAALPGTDAMADVRKAQVDLLAVEEFLRQLRNADTVTIIQEKDGPQFALTSKDQNRLDPPPLPDTPQRVKYDTAHAMTFALNHYINTALTKMSYIEFLGFPPNQSEQVKQQVDTMTTLKNEMGKILSAPMKNQPSELLFMKDDAGKIKSVPVFPPSEVD